MRDGGRGEIAKHEPFAPPPRFRLVPFEQIQLSTDRHYLVKGIIPREGLIVVWGRPKSGKSFWTYDLLLHVALGWEYRSRCVSRGTVVYIACEGERGLNARTEAFRRARLAEATDPVPFYLLITRLDLAREHEALLAEIRTQLGPDGCCAIAIDTLNRSLTGSESSDQDMSAYIRGADALREAFRCAVVIVHHCGITDTRPRGHTSLVGAADAQVAVARDAAGVITATVEYMKDGEEGATVNSKLSVIEVGTDEDGELITSCVIEPVEGRAKPRGCRSVTGQARIALDQLRSALADEGAAPPNFKDFPGGQRPVVPLDVWRSRCKRAGLSEGDSDENFKTAWKRVRHTLRNRGLIGIWDDLVWIADAEGDKGT